MRVFFKEGMFDQFFQLLFQLQTRFYALADHIREDLMGVDQKLAYHDAAINELSAAVAANRTAIQEVKDTVNAINVTLQQIQNDIKANTVTIQQAQQDIKAHTDALAKIDVPAIADIKQWKNTLGVAITDVTHGRKDQHRITFTTDIDVYGYLKIHPGYWDTNEYLPLPFLTSNENEKYIAGSNTDRNEKYPPYYVFDGDIQTSWESSDVFDAATGLLVHWSSPGVVVGGNNVDGAFVYLSHRGEKDIEHVNGYKFYIVSHASDGEFPRSWMFVGNNDAKVSIFSDWTLIHEVKDGTYTTPNFTYISPKLNTTDYRSYGIIVTSVYPKFGTQRCVLSTVGLKRDYGF